MALIRNLFWFAIFVVSTFVFTVIFEHGISNFGGNAEVEYRTWEKTVQKWIDGGVERKKDTSDQVP
ncbi:MAG TPA: hypothetical protein VFG14_14860 [Chthoniobacteraceae bacterium]|jgi:hypothetical protein|nr:hypothetical protein [Chthoniobacteraceae bacterium]